MAETSAVPTIDQLLEERARYESWLAKLASAPVSTSPTVRERVEKDYRGRLEQVMTQLRTHAESVRAELARQRKHHDDLRMERTKAQEDFDEASLRNAVGEYEPADWTRIADAATARLADLDARLDTVAREIHRLTDVQTLVESKPPAAAAPAPAPAAQPTPPPQPAVTAVPGLPNLPPVPAAGPTEDELAFLRSVASPALPQRPKAVSAEQPSVVAPVAPAPDGAAKKAAATEERTLKCAECGAANRASEWYCERCGAELTEV